MFDLLLLSPGDILVAREDIQKSIVVAGERIPFILPQGRRCLYMNTNHPGTLLVTGVFTSPDGEDKFATRTVKCYQVDFSEKGWKAGVV